MLISTTTRPSHLVVDATYVYWIEQASGAIYRIPKAGGAPQTVAVNEVQPAELVVTNTAVLWLNRGDTPQTVRRAYKSGGGVATVVSGSIDSITANETTIFYNAAPNLYSVPIAGGMATLVHSQPPPGIGDIAVDGPDLFMTTVGADSQLKRIPVAGGAATTLSQCKGCAWTGNINVTVNSAHIAWRVGTRFQLLDRNRGCANQFTDANVYERYTLPRDDQVIYVGNNTAISAATLTPVPFFYEKARRPTALVGVNEVVVAADDLYLYWGEPTALVRLRR